MKDSPKSNYPALEIDQYRRSTGGLLTPDLCSIFQYIFLCLRNFQRVSCMHTANTVSRRRNTILFTNTTIRAYTLAEADRQPERSSAKNQFLIDRETEQAILKSNKFSSRKSSIQGMTRSNSHSFGFHIKYTHTRPRCRRPRCTPSCRTPSL
jgi:hypothetical protein